MMKLKLVFVEDLQKYLLIDLDICMLFRLIRFYFIKQLKPDYEKTFKYLQKSIRKEIYEKYIEEKM